MSKWKFRVSNHGALRSFPLIFWMEAGSEIGASPQGHTVSWEPGLGRNVVCHPLQLRSLGSQVTGWPLDLHQVATAVTWALKGKQAPLLYSLNKGRSPGPMCLWDTLGLRRAQDLCQRRRGLQLNAEQRLHSLRTAQNTEPRRGACLGASGDQGVKDWCPLQGQPRGEHSVGNRGLPCPLFPDSRAALYWRERSGLLVSAERGPACLCFLRVKGMTPRYRRMGHAV